MKKEYRVGSKIAVNLSEDATIFEIVEIDGFNVGLTYPVLMEDGTLGNTVTQWVDKSFIRKVIKY